MALHVASDGRAEGEATAAHPSGDVRFKLVDNTLKRHAYQRAALIEVLHTAQEAFGYLSGDLLAYVAAQLRVPLAEVYGVATFYHMFSFTPLGEHTCTVCLGTACYVKRSGEILAKLEEAYGVSAGQTTPDGRFSLAIARCLGSCGLAPVMVLDGRIVGQVDPAGVLAQVAAAHDAPKVTAAAALHRTAEDHREREEAVGR
jgi:bidirectional [NiFe] hydrogenase diaphorase subunit